MSRESQHTSRAWWPLFGLAAVAFGHTATWMAQFALSPDELRVGGQVMFDAYNDDGTELLFRLSAGMGMLGIAALVVFGAGFRRMLEQRVPRESLLPAVAGNALIATAGALLVAFVFRAMVFDTIAEYGVETQVTTYSLSQNVPLAAWVGVGVAEVVTAIAAFKYGAFGKGFGWFSAVLAALTLIVVLTGTPFPGNVAAGIWLIGAAVVAMRGATVANRAPALTPVTA